MPISVLGPLEVEGLRPRDRVLLAALAARAGAVVAGDELAEACWGDARPSTWWQQIKTSVAAIRAELGPDAVRTDARGYALGVDPGTIDAARFEHAVEAAREHAVRGDPSRAAAGLRRALGLWRGTPFSELPDWGPARIEAARLEEIRASAEEELVEFRLAAGETGEVVPDAQRLVDAQPLRERRWASLAIALYRCGQQARALEVLRSARTRFADELGIDPGERLATLERAVLRQDPELAAPAALAASDVCPYPGLLPFGQDAADRYFGRDVEIATLLDRVVPGRVVAVVGPSGSGKSSLLLGGVVPSLAAGARSFAVVPIDAVLTETLAVLIRLPAHPDVLVVDQFEELFLLDPTVRAAVCDGLGTLIDDGATLLVTLRSDFLDRATALPQIGTRIGAGVFGLGPLSAAGLREAIERPAAGAGVRIEPGLTELLLRDAEGRPAALPHLAHALVETWRRREGGTLTVDGYASSGGVAGAIAASAERRFLEMDDDERRSCRAVLMRLLRRDEEGGIVRRRVALAALVDDPRRARVIEHLVAARILAVDGDVLTVAHEAVATAWPRLGGWLTEDADSALLLRRIEESAAGWEAGGRSVDDLPRGARLEALLEWRDQAGPDLTPGERSFLDEADALRRSELDSLAAQAARQRRQNRQLRGALGAVATLLVVALAVGGLAVTRQLEATAARDDARIEALGATATSLVDTDRDAGALLAAELYRRHPDDVRVRSALLTLLSAPGTPDHKVSFRNDERIFAAAIPGTDQVVVAQDGITLAEGGHGLRLSIWDMARGRLVSRLPTRLPDAVTYFTGGIHVRDDGVAVLAYPTWVDAQSCCGTVLVSVQLATGRILAGPTELPYATSSSGAFVDGGRTLVLRNWDSTEPVWIDVDRLRARWAGGRTSSTDGLQSIATAGDDVLIAARDRIDRFDGRTRRFLGSIRLASDIASADIHALDDGTALVSGEDGVARIRLADGRVLWQQRPPTDGRFCDRIVAEVARGAFVCSDGVSWESRISDGAVTGRTFPAQAEWIIQAEDLDGSLLIVNQRTKPFIARYRLDGSGPISTLVAAGRRSTDGFVDGRTVVVDAEPAGTTGEEMLWDVVADRQVGDASDAVDPLGSGRIGRYSAGTAQYLLTDVAGDGTSEVHGGRFDGSGFAAVPGATPGRAFAIGDSWIQPFDTRTGAAVGPGFDFAGKQLDQYWVMVHDAPSSDRAVVSWWDVDDATMKTATFALATGRRIDVGLIGDTASIMLPGGDVISTTSSELRRSGPDLVPRGSLPKPAAGANQFELSRDGGTLLLQGIGNPAALYDVASGTRIGREIATDSVDAPSAHLSPDGRTLVTNSSDGVLRWELDPANMARAACAMSGRALTATEWRTYFGDEPQVDTCARLTGS